MFADGAAIRARTLRRAMLQPDRYPAAALAEWPDADRAHAIRGNPRRIRQLCLGAYPRRACCEQAGEQLGALLWGLGVQP